MKAIISSILFSGIGLGIFVVGFFLFDKVTPYRLWAEIVEKQNQALAIVVASISIALGLIISAAMHG
jgi:uncharacterized membrane protein YjfL (UPF0719 family)